MLNKSELLCHAAMRQPVSEIYSLIYYYCCGSWEHETSSPWTERVVTLIVYSHLAHLKVPNIYGRRGRSSVAETLALIKSKFLT